MSKDKENIGNKHRGDDFLTGNKQPTLHRWLRGNNMRNSLNDQQANTVTKGVARRGKKNKKLYKQTQLNLRREKKNTILKNIKMIVN